eukprot:GHUV01052124.1.p1 GENE.GHUV01052124.1~~GHUV01052124.1.p1  ORF type:complete len:140 (-),score=21.67 GHUV01052124.1:164-583(-)
MQVSNNCPQKLRQCVQQLACTASCTCSVWAHFQQLPPTGIHPTLTSAATQVRQLVHKYPKVLSTPPQRVQAAVERLRQLSYTREEWARDFETISPSFLAFFLRDSTDVIIRLEYLASTGEKLIGLPSSLPTCCTLHTLG